MSRDEYKLVLELQIYNTEFLSAKINSAKDQCSKTLGLSVLAVIP